jgi:hypothetical protein
MSTNGNGTRPGAEMESQMDKMGISIAKDIFNKIKEKIKKALRK